MFGYLCGKALMGLSGWNTTVGVSNSALTFTSCFICAPEKIQKASIRESFYGVVAETRN